MAILFYVITIIPNIFISGAVYLAAFILISFIFYHKNINKFIHSYFSKNKNNEDNTKLDNTELTDNQ